VSYAAGVDPCLVGTWVRATSTTTIVIDGTPRTFTGGPGSTVTFRSDGVIEVAFSNASYAATVNGSRWQSVTNGLATGRYQTANGAAIYSGWTVTGQWVLYRNGRWNNGGDLSMGLGPEQYVCGGDTLSITTDAGAEQFTRVAR
jgi:hypothetical protein